jgi:hypothetical protein
LRFHHQTSDQLKQKPEAETAIMLAGKLANRTHMHPGFSPPVQQHSSLGKPVCQPRQLSSLVQRARAQPSSPKFDKAMESFGRQDMYE